MAEVGWGILGCARIAAKVCAAIQDAGNARVVSVASRNLDKAEAFVAANAPGAKAYGCYEELLADPAVQVVYIPLPTSQRHEWVMKAAEKKQHILSEKPLPRAYQAAQQQIEACEKAGVQFMDNTMFMHHDRFQEMRKVLDEVDRFGTPKFVHSSLTVPNGNEESWARNNIRMKRDTERLGCLGDLGWYCVRFTLWAFDYDMPELVRCDYMEVTDGNVPVHALAALKLSGGRSATFDCSFKHCLRQWAEVVSEKATLAFDEFVIPSRLNPAGYRVMTAGAGSGSDDELLTHPRDTLVREVEGCMQHTRLIESFSRLVAEGRCEAFWPRVSLQTQMVVAALVGDLRSAIGACGDGCPGCLGAEAGRLGVTASPSRRRLTEKQRLKFRLS